MQSKAPHIEIRTRHCRLVLFAPLPLLIIIALFTMLAGCGGGTATYVDEDHRYSFSYGDTWDLLETPASALPAGASQSVGVFDPQGSDAGNDLTFDYVAVDVYDLGDAQIPTLEEMKEGFDFYLSQLEASDDSLWVLDEPSTTVVNELPALVVTYMYRANDTEIRCSEYRLIDTRGYVLSLYTQSSSENWERNQEVFDTFLDTFTLHVTQ